MSTSVKQQIERCRKNDGRSVCLWDVRIRLGR